MKKNDKPELSATEIKDLIQVLESFAKWLVKKQIITEFPPKVRYIELPSSDSDWTMRFNEKNQTVSFNTILRKSCSFEYFKSIIIHEFFHLAVQKVPNKDEAIKIKDDFGGELMKLIDIEADFFTALFYKEVLNYSLIKVLNLFYEAGQVFGDKWIRKTKLERYLGTLLSITKMFFNNPNKVPLVLQFDLYLPSISPMYLEENMHVLVLRKEHIYFEEINATLSDLLPIRKCYTNIDTFTLKGYINEILNFTSKALSLPIPKKIVTELSLTSN